MTISGHNMRISGQTTCLLVSLNKACDHPTATGESQRYETTVVVLERGTSSYLVAESFPNYISR